VAETACPSLPPLPYLEALRCQATRPCPVLWRVLQQRSGSEVRVGGRPHSAQVAQSTQSAYFLRLGAIQAVHPKPPAAPSEGVPSAILKPSVLVNGFILSLLSE